MAYYLAIIFVNSRLWFFINVIGQSKENVKIRNDLLAFAYIIKDIGPSVSSVSIVGIVAVEDELFLVFIVGLACSYFGRKLRDIIFVKTTKQKKNFKKLTAFVKEVSTKYPKNKCQLFMAILKALVPNPPEKVKKTPFGYSTFRISKRFF